MFTALFLISEGTADIKICGLPVGGTVEAKGGSAPYLQGISAVIRDSPLSISTNAVLFLPLPTQDHCNSNSNKNYS